MSENATRFAESARETFAQFQTAVWFAIEDASIEFQSAQELGRSLGLDKSLAWNLYRLLNAEPLDGVRHLPGRQGLAILVKALRDAGAAEPAARGVEEAVAGALDLMETHAGDRATLDALIGALSTEAFDATAEKRLRDLHRGAVFVWGMDTRVALTTSFIFPGKDDPTMLDIARVSGSLGFRRLRPDASLTFDSVQFHTKDGAPVSSAMPIETQDDPHAAPLLRAFCRGNFAGTDSIRVGEDRIEYRAVGDQVGADSDADIVTALISRSVAPRYPKGGRTSTVSCSFDSPTRHYQLDLFLHRDLGVNDVETMARSTIRPADADLTPRNLPRLPLRPTLKPLGAGLARVATKHAPRYREMLESVTGTVGWDPSVFQGYRLEMKYPPIGSALGLEFRLSPPPEGGPSVHV